MSKNGDKNRRSVASEQEEKQLQVHKRLIAFGNNTRAERNRLGLTQEAFAELIDVSNSTLRRIESPDSNYSPSFRDVLRISFATGKTVDELLLECDPKDDPLWLASQIEYYATLLNAALKKQNQ